MNPGTRGRVARLWENRVPLAKKFASLSGRLMLLDWQKLSPRFYPGDRIHLEKIEQVKKQYKIEFDLCKAVKLMLINRLVKPKSKLGTNRWKRKLYGEATSSGGGTSALSCFGHSCREQRFSGARAL